jgi:DtxR family transcriptional regulator, Mn-dependent transcriptional regulator
MLDDDRPSENTEEYLEILYKLIRSGKRVSTSAITEKTNFTTASVTQMPQKLDSKRDINYSPNNGASLTDKGIAIGKRITGKHRWFDRFFYNILKIKKDRVQKQACEIESSLFGKRERALCQLLEHPDKYPDNYNPIPANDLRFSSCEECLKQQGKGLSKIGTLESNSLSLVNLKERNSGRVVSIRGNHKVIRRLLDMGITPNATIKIIKVAPLGGPVEISVRGSNLALGRSIASNVFVDLIDK